MELAIASQNRENGGLPARMANLRPFQKGNAANPGGRPKSALFNRKLRKQLMANVANGITRIDCVSDALISAAERADVQAATFIRDCVDGRPSSSGDTGDSQTMAIQINIDTVGGQVQVKE